VQTLLPLVSRAKPVQIPLLNVLGYLREDTGDLDGRIIVKRGVLHRDFERESLSHCDPFFHHSPSILGQHGFNGRV
jgi:hypothetical protein